MDQPKGIEVVKDAIRRLQFTQQLRKSETGAKTRKVEITISVDGVAIQVRPIDHIVSTRKITESWSRIAYPSIIVLATREIGVGVMILSDEEDLMKSISNFLFEVAWTSS